MSRNPQTEGFIIDSSTYNYLLGLDQTPTPEFTETTSTTPDKIRLEELEEFAKKTKEKGGLAEAMAEQKAKIKAWEKKVASSPAPSVSSPRRRGSSELEPETEKESAEVFVVQTQPKIITLTQPDQEQLQAVKNAFEKGGEANFRKEVEEKVRTEIETRLTPSKEADFLVSVTVDTLTKTIKNLPPEIQREIKIIDPPLAPLTALTDSQKTAQMEGVKKIINEAVLATNQVTEVLGITASIVAPALGQLYQPIKEEDSKNFEVMGTKPSFKDGFIARINKLVELENEINRLGPDLTEAQKQTLLGEFFAMAEREDGYLQFISHAVQGKRMEGDWGQERTSGQGITAYAKNRSLEYLQNKLSVKFGGEAGEKGLQVMFGKKSVATIKNQLTNRISTKVAAATAKATATKTAAGVALKAGGAKLAASLGLKGVLTALGTVAGPIGWIGGIIAGSFLEKIFSKIGIWIKKHPKEFFFGAAASLGLPAIVTGSTLLAIPAGLALAAGVGPRAVVSAGRAGLGLFLGTITGTLLTISTTVLAIIVATPILVALILFIINNGAYMIPPSVNTSGAGGTLAGACPDIWPTDSGYLTQGAYCPIYSHSTLEAIDVGVNGNPVYATHDGSVSFASFDSCYGNNIDIVSECDGVAFYSRYSHLTTINVVAGGKVRKGQQIGVSGNTGTCTTGPHLHYEFKDNKKYPNSLPYMWTPYLPKDVPRECCEVNTCNTNIP